MLGGMGEEEVYQVTCFEEKKDAPVEEEAAGDMGDPFAMLGGMGEEEVYQVTCFEEKKDAPVEKVDIPDATRELIAQQIVRKAAKMDAGSKTNKDMDEKEKKRAEIVKKVSEAKAKQEVGERAKKEADEG